MPGYKFVRGYMCAYAYRPVTRSGGYFGQNGFWTITLVKTAAIVNNGSHVLLSGAQSVQIPLCKAFRSMSGTIKPWTGKCWKQRLWTKSTMTLPWKDCAFFTTETDPQKGRDRYSGERPPPKKETFVLQKHLSRKKELMCQEFSRIAGGY